MASLVFRWLPPVELNKCMLVCKSWSVWACAPGLWPRLSLAHCRVTAAHIQGIVRRQPASLVLDWSTVSSKQLGWLLPRLPQLLSLSLQGCVYATCVVALRTCTCPMLVALDLSYVSGMNDCCLREILSPPPDSRPGMTDNKSRLRNLRELVLVGCDVSDVSLRYIFFLKITPKFTSLLFFTKLFALGACLFFLTSQLRDALAKADLKIIYISMDVFLNFIAH